MRVIRHLLAWLVALPWAVWAVVRLLGLEDRWLTVAIIAFTPWAAGAAVVALVLTLLLRSRLAAVVAALSALALVAVVAPRAIDDGDAEAAGEGRELRVLSLNLLGPGARPDAVLRLVRDLDPDVVALQELTDEAGEALDEAGLARRYPEGIHRPSAEARGSALYTRRPVRQIPAAPAHSAATLRLSSGRTIELWSVHPNAPRDEPDTVQWRRELRTIPGAGEGERLRILAGDFNATLDHRELRDLLGTGYTDAAEAAGEGLKPTWPVGRRMRPAVTIDHVLVEDEASVGAVSIHTVPGTDHRAVFAELVLPPRG